MFLVIFLFNAIGFLIDFVSGPVSSGFTSAVALIIVTSQVKDILGIPAKGSTFTQIWSSIFDNLEKTCKWDVALGSTCIVLLLLMRVRTALYYKKSKQFVNVQFFILDVVFVQHWTGRRRIEEEETRCYQQDTVALWHLEKCNSRCALRLLGLRLRGKSTIPVDW